MFYNNTCRPGSEGGIGCAIAPGNVVAGINGGCGGLIYKTKGIGGYSGAASEGRHAVKGAKANGCIGIAYSCIWHVSDGNGLRYRIFTTKQVGNNQLYRVGGDAGHAYGLQ